MTDIRANYDRIFIEGMTFTTLIGVLEHEKVQPQPVHVDVDLSVMPVSATRTDRLEQTISYAAAYERISQIIQTEHFGLVERLAGCIAEKLLLDHETLMAVTVTIRKPEAPLPGPFTSAGITITRVRGDFGLATQADLSLGVQPGRSAGDLASGSHASGGTSGDCNSLRSPLCMRPLRSACSTSRIF